MKTLWACGHCRSFNLQFDAAVDVNDPENVHIYDNTSCIDCGYDGNHHYKIEDDNFDIPLDNKLPVELAKELEYL